MMTLAEECAFWEIVLSAPGRTILCDSADFPMIADVVRERHMDGVLRVESMLPGECLPGSLQGMVAVVDGIAHVVSWTSFKNPRRHPLRPQRNKR